MGKNQKNNQKRKINVPGNLSEIESYLKQSKTYLGAVFVSSFKKILLKAQEYSLICYCKSQWFCIYSSKNTFEIFDPSGFFKKAKDLNKKFINFLKTHIQSKILYCNPKIQSDNSEMCGLYIIFFIRMREIGYTFLDILRKFTKDYQKNDSLVKKYVKKIYSR